MYYGLNFLKVDYARGGGTKSLDNIAHLVEWVLEARGLLLEASVIRMRLCWGLY